MKKKKGGFIAQWNPIQVNCEVLRNRSDATTTIEQANKTKSILNVSNSDVPIPHGIFYQNNFVSKEQEKVLIDEILQREFVWEGFDQRRRVQRYTLEIENNGHHDESSAKNHYKTCNRTPSSILHLWKQLEACTGHRALQVVVEEYTTDKCYRSGENATNHTVTTFETSTATSHSSQDENSLWFVAQIPLRGEAYQHWNQPKKRQANCWSLRSQNHWTDVRMDQRSLLVKTEDCLFQWRSRVTAAPTKATALPSSSESLSSSSLSESEESASILVLKFYSLPEENSLCDNTQSVKEDEVDNYGYIPCDDDRIPPLDFPMPPLNELLTIVITTSPIKSNPSTEVIERTMETLKFGGSDFSCKCRKIIVCDGCRLKDDSDHPDIHGHRKVSVKHTNAKQAMRNGIVTVSQAENYQQYKENLKQLCLKANESTNNNMMSPFQNTYVVELEERHGYGFALRHALRHFVDTQYVCVIQHDRTFMRPTPISETVQAMWRNPAVKYIGMSMRSNLLSRDLFVGKYGRSYQNDFDKAVLRLPELVVDASKYGPESESAKAMACDSDKLLLNIKALVETYRASAQNEIPQAVNGAQLNEGMHQMILTPTLFWYDNVHVCETSHYRDFIFNPLYKMVARGGFVEDKLSPVIKRTVERLGFRDGHSRFGCFLLDDASGMFFTGHLDGGSYLTRDAKEKLQAANTNCST